MKDLAAIFHFSLFSSCTSYLPRHLTIFSLLWFHKLVKTIITPLSYCSRAQSLWLLFLLPCFSTYIPFSTQHSKWPLKSIISGWLSVEHKIQPIIFPGFLRLLWVELYHPKRCVSLEPQKVTFFGIKLGENVIKGNLKIRSSWMRVDPKPNDRCPFRKRRRHKDRGKKTLWRKRQKLVSCCQKPRNSQSTKAEDARKSPLLEPSEWG